MYSTECRKTYEKVECKSFWLILCKKQKPSRPHQVPYTLHSRHLTHCYCSCIFTSTWQHEKLIWRLLKTEVSMERWNASPFGPPL
jgi:hypothetical protein